ncbi:Zn-dependent hydrolase [Qipengyuania citrea LAMA 915]|uniref:Zn-dependent hydrolase n=1 Tax=Qipengyuania citrea LAMA 915 TaxID=1306953 RepID=A0A0L1KHY8_9SPHN|nr:Zn-dependent hydrolase [Qipengyuania citrea LAMA 915]
MRSVWIGRQPFVHGPFLVGELVLKLSRREALTLLLDEAQGLEVA